MRNKLQPIKAVVKVALLTGIAIFGCRLPKLYHVRGTPAPFVYDTSFEREVSEGTLSVAADDPRWQYVHTLAEPVSVVEWSEGDSSLWKIFYATNRGALKDQTQRILGYGNIVASSPQYGICGVQLPHRERGKDIASQKQGNQDVQPALSIQSLEVLDDATFLSQLNELVQRSRQRDVLIFVHGFNVSFEQAVVRATQLAADIPFNGAIVVYAWPSQGGIDQYERDGEIVDESLQAFTSFLVHLGNNLGTECTVNLVVHSMGNRLVTRSLWHLPDSFTQPPRFKELVFCAPDVEVDEFKRHARQIVKVCDRATIYKSCNDSALIASKWRNLEERAGESFNPILVKGIDTIETAVVDTSLMGHSYYGSNPSILRDLFAIVKAHQPAAQRSWLQQKKLPFVDASWWLIADFPQPLDWRWHFDTPRRVH